MADGQQSPETPIVSLNSRESLPEFRNKETASSARQPQATEIPPIIESTDAAARDQAKAGEVRELIWKEATPVQPLPNTPREPFQEEIPLSSLNLFGIGINWEGLRNLGKAASEVTGDYVSKGEVADIVYRLKPPEELYRFLPMVTSAIAHEKYPEIPVKLPTTQELQAIKPWISTVENIISRFSPNLAQRFKRYVEKQGERTVLNTGNRAAHILEVVESIPNPQQEFLKEIYWAYQNLATPQTREGFWGDEEIPIEDKIHDFVGALKNAKRGSYSGNSHWLNKKDFPLMLRLLPSLGIPPDNISEGDAAIAGAELMQGIEAFLRQQGIRDIRQAPRPREFDLFDIGSWGRGFAEAFASDRLERVKMHLPTLLTHAYHAMPTDGPTLSAQVYKIARDVTVLSNQGEDPRVLANAMFDRSQLRQQN